MMKGETPEQTFTQAQIEAAIQQKLDTFESLEPDMKKDFLIYCIRFISRVVSMHKRSRTDVARIPLRALTTLKTHFLDLTHVLPLPELDRRVAAATIRTRR